MEELIGKCISRVFMNDEYLKFETDQGDIVYTAEGDCCSHSYFYDFLGIEKLKNGPVKSVEQIDLEKPDDDDSRPRDVVKAYGYRIITEDPQFGEVSSTMSFRNDSNGYYGGWLHLSNYAPAQLEEVTGDYSGGES